MSTVLVVDDSAVDRRLIGGLLEKSSDWSVRYASSGKEALELIEQQLPDVVVTDLLMPDMDGLQLVRLLRAGYPSVPVILITSEESDDVAVKALHHGAASYVPKRVLARNLLDSIRSVLAVSGERKRHARLLECMNRNECEFVLNNDETLFPALVGFLQECATQIGLFDEAERVRIGIALEEALANALYHGNLEVDSALREQDSDRYAALVAERLQQRPYHDRLIHVDVRLSRDEGVFVIRDEGPGFDPSSLPDPTDPANLENVTGRGVLLMRSFMDEIRYSDQGNEVTLVKRRSSTGTDGDD
ncbi:MAG: response regulator [Pirellulales bacterium]